MDEKMNRRLTILLSAPITPFQIILGKMLPYVIFALFSYHGDRRGLQRPTCRLRLPSLRRPRFSSLPFT